MKIDNKKSLLHLLLSNQSVLKVYGVYRIGLFGSFVRNEQTEKSDVDLLVEFQEGKKNFDNFIKLSFLLEDLFGRKVEIVTPESLNKYFAPYILNEVEYVSFSH
ncbi:MAG: nucleotidyltransferase family protein [Ignavibacteriales bacterium]|nr:nucleotidyltransferase family protein [Ignavibacteriales bacterium]